MATQAAVKTVPSRQQKPSPTHAPRAKNARIFDYSRYRLQLSKPEDFAAYVAGYPDKTGLLAYIYRVLPKIDMSLIGLKEHTIKKTASLDEMMPDWIARNFGRGKYTLKLNDANRDKGQTEVCVLTFFIEDPDREPVYDVRTLCLGSSENIDEINRQLEKGALLRDPAGQPRLRTERDGPAGPPVAPVAPAGSTDLVSRDVIGAVLLKLINQGTQNPHDMVEQSITIAKLLRPENAAPALSADQVAEVVLAKLGRNHSRDEDPFQTWERIESFIAKTRGTVPATSAVAGGGDNMLAGVSDVLKSAAVLIPQIIQGVEFLQKQKARLEVSIERRAPGRAGQPGPGAPAPAPMSMADRIAEIAELAFVKIGEGINGFDFAAFVCQWHPGGLEVYRFLEPHGAVGVLGLLAMNPQAAPILADEAKRLQLEKFLSEFFSYDPEDSGEAEDSPDAPGPVAAAS